MVAANAMIQQHFVEQAVKAGARHRVEVVRFNTNSDSIAQVIVTRAAELKATAVVLASHHKSPLQEFFVGSVSKEVLMSCQQTVVVLH